MMNVRESEVVRFDWCKPLIIRVEKRGDKRSCDNNGVIGLTNVVSEVLSRLNYLSSTEWCCGETKKAVTTRQDLGGKGVN